MAPCSVILPEGRGRFRVRFIRLSYLYSCRWFNEEAPLASRKIPRTVQPNPGSRRVVWSRYPVIVVILTAAVILTFPNSSHMDTLLLLTRPDRCLQQSSLLAFAFFFLLAMLAVAIRLALFYKYSQHFICCF